MGTTIGARVCDPQRLGYEETQPNGGARICSSGMLRAPIRARPRSMLIFNYPLVPKRMQQLDPQKPDKLELRTPQPYPE